MVVDKFMVDVNEIYLQCLRLCDITKVDGFIGEASMLLERVLDLCVAGEMKYSRLLNEDQVPFADVVEGFDFSFIHLCWEATLLFPEGQVAVFLNCVDHFVASYVEGSVSSVENEQVEVVLRWLLEDFSSYRSRCLMLVFTYFRVNAASLIHRVDVVGMKNIFVHVFKLAEIFASISMVDDSELFFLQFSKVFNYTNPVSHETDFLLAFKTAQAVKTALNM